nr:Chain C, PHE-MET-ASN-LYS-PHE-ILE-TYR-GLU-ILE [Homo sapiens]7RE7_F Chain F, PHE-MET-ASN-LYS-PHE-ILE-TYR-GLU-ILE [Homo sapiens]7RE8_C Chain C, PHE-MET-ASN-LYS-PHE-ILE-TYR-GLU-ILE [Homo sapiens]7RE8_F Chain F, PHE-MET-ASN-LYS-PHE-ILE-TYR-GLU-ILE [Homo sapiens]
FMNKFIYEI